MSRIVSRLLILGSVAVVLAALAAFLVPVWMQRYAVWRIRNEGGYVYYSGECDASGREIKGAMPHGPPWLRKLVGDDLFDVPVTVNMSNYRSVKVPGYRFMPAIGRLRHLRVLSLGDCPLSPQDLAHLSTLKELQMLGLAGAEIGDSDLVPLKDLPLEWLSLFGTHVSDKGMPSVGQIRSLRSLNLTRTRVGNAGLKYLDGLPNLKSIDLSRTKVTHEGISSFRERHPAWNINWEPLKKEQ